MSRVLLVQPHYGKVYGRFKSVATEYPPLGLAYIAAVLGKGGHEVKIADMQAEHITERKYIQILEDFKPVAVGFSVLTPTSSYSHKLAKITKQILSGDVKIIFGGIHPTILPAEELQDSYVDIIVRGEGEYTVLDLINTLEKGGDVQRVLGISYRRQHEVLHNPIRPLIQNLDELPYPARHLLSGRYYFVDAKSYPLDAISTARGCPYQCIFCERVWGRKFRARSVNSVIGEIEHLVTDRNVREIHVIDDIFNLHLKRAKAVCDEISRRKLNLSWALPSGIRANTRHFDKEFAEKLQASGCWLVAFGIESGDQNVLNKAKKNLTLDEVRRAVRLCREAGIEEVWGFFIIGLPDEDKETARRTIDFACELDLDIAKFHVLVPFPGTEVYDMFDQHGFIKIKDWPKYGIHIDPVYDLPTLTAQEILELQKRAYQSFYFRPRLLIRWIRRVFSSPRRCWNVFKAGCLVLNYTIQR